MSPELYFHFKNKFKMKISSNFEYNSLIDLKSSNLKQYFYVNSFEVQYYLIGRKNDFDLVIFNNLIFISLD